MSELNTALGPSVDVGVVDYNIRRIQGQIFKLLPSFEKGKDYKKPAQTLAIEVLGLSSILPQDPKIFSLACKLQGMHEQDMDYMTLRRTVFDCCNICGNVRDNLCR